MIDRNMAETISECRSAASSIPSRKTATDENVRTILMKMAEIGYAPSEPAYKAVKWYLEGYQLQMYGKTGNGKSSFFKALSEVKMADGRKPFRFAVLPMSILNVASPTDVVAFMDFHANDEMVVEDIGSDCTTNDYGQKFDMLATILTIREYTSARTHFTTNIGEANISKIYGRRVFSRMHGTKLVDFNCERSYRNEDDYSLVPKSPTANYMVMLNTEASRRISAEFRQTDDQRRALEIADAKMREDF